MNFFLDWKMRRMFIRAKEKKMSIRTSEAGRSGILEGSIEAGKVKAPAGTALAGSEPAGTGEPLMLRGNLEAGAGVSQEVLLGPLS